MKNCFPNGHLQLKESVTKMLSNGPLIVLNRKLYPILTPPVEETAINKFCNGPFIDLNLDLRSFWRPIVAFRSLTAPVFIAL